MALNFPDAPAEGATYSSGSASWQYNAGRWVGTDVTLSVIPIASGGTGQTTAPAALTALGAAPIASPAFSGTPTAPTLTLRQGAAGINTALNIRNDAGPATVTTGGLWRNTVGPGGNYNVQMNTAATGDFSTMLQAATLSPTAGLTVGGTLTVGTTGGPVLTGDANYLIIYSPGGAAALGGIVLGGTAVSSLSYYRNATHCFQSRDASALFAQFDATGAKKPGGGTWADSSDIRLKRNVLDYTTGIAAILQLRPVSFEFNGKAGTPDNGRVYVGLIANEAIEVMPEMVSVTEQKFEPDDDHMTEILSLDATALIYALVNSCKELAERLTVLEERLMDDGR